MRYSLERCCQTLKFFKKIGKDTWRVLDLSASVFGYNLTGIYLGVEGLEPSRPIDQQILSLLCLPFHHTPIVFKATPRFELGIEDLQSTALPLGHIALK